MNKTVLIVLSLLMATSLIAETTNLESQGNLESETQTELNEVADITNTNNPVDIFKLVRSKIEQEKYDEAALAFCVGTGYGMYDMHRVEDNTAHQALSVLRMNTGMGIAEEKLNKFQTTLNALFENPDKIITLLNKIGKPDYHPTYMIQHGMGAFTGNKSKDGLVSDFDSDKAWKEILEGLKG